MNPHEASDNKIVNVTGNGTLILPVPTNPKCKFVLVRIIVGTKGGSGNIAQIYDSNATLGANSDLKKGTLDTVNVTGNVEYGIPFVNGLYIIVGGGTTPDLTIVYKETP